MNKYLSRTCDWEVEIIGWWVSWKFQIFFPARGIIAIFSAMRKNIVGDGSQGSIFKIFIYEGQALVIFFIGLWDKKPNWHNPDSGICWILEIFFHWVDATPFHDWIGETFLPLPIWKSMKLRGVVALVVFLFGRTLHFIVILGSSVFCLIIRPFFHFFQLSNFGFMECVRNPS